MFSSENEDELMAELGECSQNGSFGDPTHGDEYVDSEDEEEVQVTIVNGVPVRQRVEKRVEDDLSADKFEIPYEEGDDQLLYCENCCRTSTCQHPFILTRNLITARHHWGAIRQKRISSAMLCEACRIFLNMKRCSR